MKISDEYRTLLVDEIEYVVKNMKQDEDPAKVLYLFSAIYGIFQRVYNIQYSEHLLFAYFILKSVYEAFIGRFKAIQQHKDTAVLLHKEQFDRLIQLSDELGKKIKAKKSIDSVLRRFVVLISSTTGNGYYLMQKGLLKL